MTDTSRPLMGLRRIDDMREEISPDGPDLGKVLRYRVRESSKGEAWAMARVAKERDWLVLTHRSGQHMWISPREALAITAVLSVAVMASFPDAPAAFEVDRSIGEGHWEPFNGIDET